MSFLNWVTTKQTLEECPKTKFMPAERLNLSAQFVDYNKKPILIFGRNKGRYQVSRMGSERSIVSGH